MRPQGDYVRISLLVNSCFAQSCAPISATVNGADAGQSLASRFLPVGISRSGQFPPISRCRTMPILGRSARTLLL